MVPIQFFNVVSNISLHQTAIFFPIPLIFFPTLHHDLCGSLTESPSLPSHISGSAVFLSQSDMKLLNLLLRLPMPFTEL